ncbi:MAG: pyroglutamyl-peptidase I [Clostridia bacterium]|nr:pyroglutamyl-peptidase I [Clostridia bacterium]
MAAEKLKTLLITGFDPFGGEAVNPSWEAVARLPDRIGDWRVEKRQIPTQFGQAAETVLAAAAECMPNVILCVGQAGGRSSVTPEVVAINLRKATIADNAGQQPRNEPVVAGAREAYFATVPVREMLAAIKARGIPAALSYSAGAFVCNDTLYQLLHHYCGTPTRVGFIHVPFLPEQAQNGQPSLALETITEALAAAIEAL